MTRGVRKLHGSGQTQVRAACLWTPQGLVDDAVVVLDASGTIVSVRPGAARDGPAFDGLVVPGLINAHAHLELSDLVGRVPPSEAFTTWVRALFTAPRGDSRREGMRAAHAMFAAGTAWVNDVSNGGHTAPWIAAAGMSGVVQHEVLGFDRQDVAARRAKLPLDVRYDSGLLVRPSPHAVFSTAPQIIADTVAIEAESPATIHLAEAAAERAFLRAGEGPFAELLDQLGRDWRWWTPPGGSAVAYLDDLGVLGPSLLLVHGIWLTEADMVRIASTGAAVCLCPRSNLHVERRLPDAASLWRHGVALALGTDSLASVDDLDLFGEMAILMSNFPDVPPETWLAAATHVGARVVGARGKGAVVQGARPGLLGLPGVKSVRAICETVPQERYWLVAPGGPT